MDRFLTSLAVHCCLALACGGRSGEQIDAELASGRDGPGSSGSTTRPEMNRAPSPAGAGGSAPGPDVPLLEDPNRVPLEPEPVASSDPALRECDDGTSRYPADQAAIDALSGCTSLHGLQLTSSLDLRPLASLKRVGSGGLTIAGDTALEGLENLEQAVSLMLMTTRAADLEALASLRQVEWLVLSSVDVPNLRRLERVEGIRNLDISRSPRIESLDGLVLPSEMNSVSLRGAAALTDITALRHVTRISTSLTLERTGVGTLPFEALGGSIGQVLLGDNPKLAEISALSGLESMDALLIYGSALRSAPRFERLSRLLVLGLEANPLLEATPAFPLITSVVSLVVRQNPELGTLLGFPALESAEYISVSQNDQLTEIDLGRLRQANQLHIFDNLQIDGAAMAAALAGVESGQSRIPLVQTTPPMSPCPWVDDAVCDSSFCLAAEDPACAFETE